MSKQPYITDAEIDYFYRLLKEIQKSIRQGKPLAVLNITYGKRVVEFARQLQEEGHDIIHFEYAYRGEKRREKEKEIKQRIKQWLLEVKKELLEKEIEVSSPKQLHLALVHESGKEKEELEQVTTELQARVTELHDKMQKGLLLNLYYKVSKVGYGALEALLAEKLLQAMETKDDLERICIFCEMNMMIGVDKIKKIYPESLAKSIGDICMVAFALRNATHFQDPVSGTELVSVMMPVYSKELESILFFLKADPESFEFVTYQVKTDQVSDEVKKKQLEEEPLLFMKRTLFYGITKESYNALKTYFIAYCLPIMYEAIRRMIEVMTQLKRIIELRLGAVTPFIEVTSLKQMSGGKEK